MKEVISVSTGSSSASVDNSAFVGVLANQNTPTIQSCLNILDKSFATRVMAWATGTAYIPGQMAQINGINIVCIGNHTSSTISNDLIYWSSASEYAVIINMPNNTYSRFSLIARTGSNGYVSANGVSDQTLCTHIVLYCNSNWVLAVEKGVYTIQNHGLIGDSQGNLYNSNINASYTNVTPTSGISNRVMQILDSNTVVVTAYEPAVNINNFVAALPSMALLYSISPSNNTFATGNIIIPSQYNRLYIMMEITSNVASTVNSSIFLCLNQNNPTSGNVINHSAYWQYIASAASTSVGGVANGAPLNQTSGYSVYSMMGTKTSYCDFYVNLRKYSTTAGTYNVSNPHINYYQYNSGVSAFAMDTKLFYTFTTNEVINKFAIYSDSNVTGIIQVYGVI